MNVTAQTLDDSYLYCHAMARRSGSNFYCCFRLLPREKRRAMEALYAFMRHTDDLGDNASLSTDVRRRQLASWRNAFEQALAGRPLADSTDSVAKKLLPAAVEIVHRYAIPPEHLREVIDGVEMDIEPRVYQTFEELSEYCHRVASAVGLSCIHIWGFDSSAAIKPALACGLAVQLTNILRDLKEDAAAGRVYLPLEDIEACGYSVEQLQRGETNPALARLIAMETARAETLYHEGCELIDHVDPSGRRIFGMMMSVYHRLLVNIQRAGVASFDTRIKLSGFQKTQIAARWLLLPPQRQSLP